MRKIIICDDEKYMQDQLKTYLEKVSEDLDEKFSVKVFSSAEELLSSSADADIILLDIAMGNLSGMDAAHVLRKDGSDVRIIFISSMTDYALEGYSVHAFGFLKKPVQYGNFLQQMEDALSSLNSRQDTVLSFQNGPDMLRISSRDISFIEVMGHSVIIHTLDDTLSYPSKLSMLEEKLSNFGFYRLHKSFLISFDHIKRVLPGYVVMDEGSQVPISKHRRKDFLDAFAEHEGKKL